MTTILVVDDDSAITEFLSILLEGEGYKVIVAHNGKEGLACLAAECTAMVLCDLMMPILNGREMCQQMQAIPRYHSIPFALMSAVSNTINYNDCRYDAVIAKPFDLDDVLATVAQLITPAAS